MINYDASIIKQKNPKLCYAIDLPISIENVHQNLKDNKITKTKIILFNCHSCFDYFMSKSICINKCAVFDWTNTKKRLKFNFENCATNLPNTTLALNATDNICQNQGENFKCTTYVYVYMFCCCCCWFK